ncbi:MAG TPA: hypothetical protein VFF43_17355, partial [Caldimonas sp.]|nr:hypothetical protein [Caldimonas sp.]
FDEDVVDGRWEAGVVDQRPKEDADLLVSVIALAERDDSVRAKAVEDGGDRVDWHGGPDGGLGSEHEPRDCCVTHFG